MYFQSYQNAFDAEAGAPQLGRRDIREAGNRRAVIDIVVVGLDTTAYFILNLPSPLEN